MNCERVEMPADGRHVPPAGMSTGQWNAAVHAAYVLAYGELSEPQRAWVNSPIRAVTAPEGYPSYRGFQVYGSDGGHYIVFERLDYNVLAIGWPVSLPRSSVRNLLIARYGRVYASARRWCASPMGLGLPLWDRMLAQKLALEHDEQAFLDVANRDGTSRWFHRPS